MSIEIIIDPNVRVAGNRTYGGFEDVLGGFVEDLAPGDPITVLEEESDVIGDGVVYEINHDKQLVYLSVDWSSLRPRPQRSAISPRTYTQSALSRVLSVNSAATATSTMASGRGLELSLTA